MPPAFYEGAGTRLSPGDIFDWLPHIRLPKPLKVVRKAKIGLPKRLAANLQGELREVFEVGRKAPNPDFDFEVRGEEVLSIAKMSKAVFLTWGSEVDADAERGNLHKKDWLIAPVFSLAAIDGKKIHDERTGETIDLGDAIRAGKSPKYFPLFPFPGEATSGYYIDFRKILPLAATHFEGLPRQWRLGPAALNDFYSQLLWFFTRKKVFFGPVPCGKCGTPVDLGVVFEGQPIDGDQG